MTRPYAEVIGDPIAQSKSPLIHSFWLGKLGIDADYRVCHVTSAQLADYVAGRRLDPDWRGCNVTIPHKEAVLALADLVDDKASAVGASNCLYRDTQGKLVATNTDVDGVNDAIAGVDLVGADVCVLGCGGAARSAFQALKDSRSNLLVLARDPEKAVRVSVAAGYPGAGVPLRAGNTALLAASLFINATQLGMAGQDPVPDFVLADLAEMDEGALVFDMVYSPLNTSLLVEARKLGLRTTDGLVMLVGQARSAFEHFFGQPAPRQHDAELRALLTR